MSWIWIVTILLAIVVAIAIAVRLVIYVGKDNARSETRTVIRSKSRHPVDIFTAYNNYYRKHLVSDIIMIIIDEGAD